MHKIPVHAPGPHADTAAIDRKVARNRDQCIQNQTLPASFKIINMSKPPFGFRRIRICLIQNGHRNLQFMYGHARSKAPTSAIMMHVWFKRLMR